MLLCTCQSTGGSASSTPVRPPRTNVTMKPMVHRTGTANRTRPPYMVNNQLKTLTPVGTAMIMLAIPKTALTFALAPVADRAVETDPAATQLLANPCPCCGGRMFIIETFQAGYHPRHRP